MTDEPVQRYYIDTYGFVDGTRPMNPDKWCKSTDVSALEAENVLLNALADVVQGAMDDGNMNEDGDGFVIPLADYRQIKLELKALTLASQERSK